MHTRFLFAAILASTSVCAAQRFLNSGPFFPRTNLHAVVVGDFTKNAAPDIFWIGTGLKLWTRVGDGRYAEQAISTTRSPIEAHGADLDGDGDTDIVAHSSGPTFWLKCDGDGGFQEITLPNTNCQSLAVGDVDGDKDADILIGEKTNQLRLLLNDGKGKFTDASKNIPSIQGPPVEILLGDLDKDGDDDILLTSTRSYSMAYLVNDGKGVFSAVSSRLPNVRFLGMELHDLNGDGAPDLTGFENPHHPRVLFNDGRGTFKWPSTPALPTTQLGNADFGDLDGDGDIDAYVGSTNYAHTTPHVYLNNGKGVLRAGSKQLAVHLLWGFSKPLVADLDQDRDLDVVLIAGHNPGWGAVGQVLHNDGKGVFSAAPVERGHRLRWQSDPTNAFASFDFDQDGDNDVIVGNDWGQPNRYLRNDGTGRFVDAENVLPREKWNTTGLKVANLDGSGLPELIVANFDQQCRILQWQSGKFVDITSQTLPTASFGATSVDTADVDGDGDLDVLFGVYDRGLNVRSRLYLNDGKGKLTDNSTTAMPYTVSAEAVAFGDFDGDKRPDIVLGGRSLQVLKNDGKGVFRLAATNKWFVDQLAVGDLDGDGDLDFATTGFAFENQGNFKFRESVFPNTYPWGSGTAICLADLDEDGDLDAVTPTGPGHRTSPRIRVLMNTGSFNFTGHTLMLIQDRRSKAAHCFDADGDGDMDFLVGTHSAASSNWTSTSQNYAFLNLTRQLQLPSWIRIGKSVTIDVYAQATSSSVSTITAISGLPAVLPLPPLGTLRIDPRVMVVLPPVMTQGGRAQITASVPANTGLLGARLYLQSLVGPNQRLTNMVAETIIR